MGVYSTAILADSPLHYWRCFENFGALAVKDIGSNGCFMYSVFNAGPGAVVTLFGNPGLGWSGVAADGGSFSTNGIGFQNFKPASGTFFVPPGIAFPVPGSLECWWFQPDNDGGTQVFWHFPTAPLNQRAVGLQFAGDVVRGLLLTNPILNGPSVSPTQWHHAVLSYSNTIVNLYVDGSSVATESISLTGNSVANDFLFGTSGLTDYAGADSGFLCEIAIYGVQLGAGQVANHFAAADSRTNTPSYYGTRPNTVQSPQGYVLGPTHTGLTTTGSFVPVGATVALLISVTTDTPEHGKIIGNPDYLLSRGYVNASNSLGTVYEFDRLVFGTQVRELPRFTSLISWSFPPNLVVSISELSVR